MLCLTTNQLVRLPDRLGQLRKLQVLHLAENQLAALPDSLGQLQELQVLELNHNQLAELYVVRAELEGLAAKLAAKHASPEEVKVLRDMIEEDRALLDDPAALARANRRFHKQIHLASHNRYLVQQLDLVHRSMALLASTSLAAEGRGETALAEHDAIVRAIEAGDGEAAQAALRAHISKAFETRLKLDAGAIRSR